MAASSIPWIIVSSPILRIAVLGGKSYVEDKDIDIDWQISFVLLCVLIATVVLFLTDFGGLISSIHYPEATIGTQITRTLIAVFIAALTLFVWLFDLIFLIVDLGQNLRCPREEQERLTCWHVCRR